MCRVLAYSGTPVLLDDLLFKPSSSLIRQTYDARMLNMLNLAGFGMAVWDDDSRTPDVPFTYKLPTIPVFDRNLKSLAENFHTTGLIAHVRGVPNHEQVTIGEQNLHPFHYQGASLALAHNGDLAHFKEMRFALIEYLRPEVARQIRGDTDSEWIYALLLSQLDDPGGVLQPKDIVTAIEKTLAILRKVRNSAGINTSSSVNLFICDGRNLLAVRFTFDYGCYDTSATETIQQDNLNYLSLWYTCGTDYGFHDGEWKMRGGDERHDSVILSSEPLTYDVSTWLEIPEYSIFVVNDDDGSKRIGRVTLDI